MSSSADVQLGDVRPSTESVETGAVGISPTASDLSSYTDPLRTRLRELIARHQTVAERLEKSRPPFAALSKRAADGDANAAVRSREVADSIVADEALLVSLTQQVNTTRATIAQHDLAVEKYVNDVQFARARLAPLLAHVDSIDAELQWACDTTRSLDGQASALLAVLGDRRFRRAMLDPRQTLIQALESRLEKLRRWHPKHPLVVK